RGAGVERQSRRFWIAAMFSFAGVALVAIGSGGELSTDLVGDALAVGGAATWAAYSVAIAPMMRRYSPFRLSAVFLLLVTLPLFAAGGAQVGRQGWDFGWLGLGGVALRLRGPPRS